MPDPPFDWYVPCGVEIYSAQCSRNTMDGAGMVRKISTLKFFVPRIDCTSWEQADVAGVVARATSGVVVEVNVTEVGREQADAYRRCCQELLAVLSSLGSHSLTISMHLFVAHRALAVCCSFANDEVVDVLKNCNLFMTTSLHNTA